MDKSQTADAESAGITPAQVLLVQSSFEHVLPIADVAGLLFYERIFTLAPEARALFGDDIALQASRTMAAVKTAVDGLDDIEQVAPFLVRLGARHVRYGVVPEHFDLVGEAFLWTLEQGLGDAFTPEVHEAWVAAFGVIARAMLIGMEQASAKLAPATGLRFVRLRWTRPLRRGRPHRRLPPSSTPRPGCRPAATRPRVPHPSPRQGGRRGLG